MIGRQGGEVRLHIAPSAVLLLAALLLLSSWQLIPAMLTAALCHEWGHIRMLRKFGGIVGEATVTALGVEMRMGGRRLSYGQEILSVAAGPITNLLLAMLLSVGGRYFPALYLFAGTQLILGLFNLIPAGPLDGGTLLWLAVAWGSDPFRADGVCRVVNLLAAAAITALALYIWRKGGSPFLLLVAVCSFGTTGKKDLSNGRFQGKIPC